MLRRVAGEVEVQLRHGRLHHPPHRLAEVGHEAHQLERALVLSPRIAEVRREQLSARVGIELVVDREVREVEEAVAHARVLPVDDPQVLAVVEEVRVQEVVVARNGVAPAALLFDPQRHRLRPHERGRDFAASVERGLPVGLDDAERVERAAKRRPVVKSSQRLRDSPQELRLAHPLGRRHLAVEEARHEPSLGLDERDHVRADPGRRGRLGSPRARPRDRSRGARCPFPATRRTKRSPSTSTLRLWFVMPPPSTSTRATRPGHTRSTAASSSLTRGSARRSDRTAARRRSPPRPSRRRSRPRPLSRPRARRGRTHTRSSARPSSHSHRS